MIDKTYQAALDERLTQVTQDAAVWALKMQPWADEAHAHLDARKNLMAHLIGGMPEVQAVMSFVPNKEAVLRGILAIAQITFIMGYCSLLVESEATEIEITDAGLKAIWDDTQNG